MARRSAPEVNAGSMADIAFLLLIFFLVTTTLEKDNGIARQLPPIDKSEIEPPKIKKKNLFIVLVNKNDELLVNDNPMQLKDIRKSAIEFLDNILKPNLRAALVPLLDRDVSHTERVRFADQMTGSMMTQPEDAIHALLGDEDDEDHYLKSCAIYTIGLLRLKTFCEEVERYLTHDNPLLRETARQTFEKISKEMDR